MASPSSANLMDFKSPIGALGIDISGTQSPGHNPFDDLFNQIEIDLDVGRPSLFIPINLNSSDVGRESLGILPNTALCRDSLAPGLINIGVEEILNPSLSPRESLGVLNISAMDLGRESIGLFNIQNSFLRRKSLENQQDGLSFNLNNFSFDDIENGLKTIKKSPLQKDNPNPELILSTSTTQDKINSLSSSGLNYAFIFSHSRIPSAVSSGSSYNMSNSHYFNSRSLEEPSRISPGSTQKDSQSVLATTNPFNEAFRISTNENKFSVSQILPSTSRKNSFASEVTNMRSRIQSLPMALDDKNFLAGIDFDGKAANVSFQDMMVCRGIEDEKEFDDSVFIEARKVACLISDASLITDEKWLDSKEHNILDATPQPDWPSDLDSSSQSNTDEKGKSSKCDKDTILKQVDKMLGMQPVNLEEKLKMKNVPESESTSLENISQNISKISGTSPNNQAENQSCASNNFSQNLSKISGISQEGNRSCASTFSQNLTKNTQTSGENASRLIQNLSDILNENENLSQIQKKEGHQRLQWLANMLCDSKNKSQPSAEDSGHSSVTDDQHLEENKVVKNENNKLEPHMLEETSGNNNDNIYHALDLSFKKNLSPACVGSPLSFLPRTPKLALANTSDTSKQNHSDSKYSNASNCSNASSKSGNLSTASRHSNISQNRVSLGGGKLKKSKLGVVIAKKGPLRAVLPVENMAKGTKSLLAKSTEGPVTPERKVGGHKFGLSSKKTSTPIQEPKLKPMAASTPASRQTKDSKEHTVSPLPRPKYTNRSFSYQPRTSNTLELPESSRTKEGTQTTTKTVVNRSRVKIDDTKLTRRNSVTEGTLNCQRESEGPMRIKRSFSTGKEPKILSALNRVRQNILNSPYYNPKRADEASQTTVLTENSKKIGTDLKGCSQELKRLSMMSQPKKPGKENLKP